MTRRIVAIAAVSALLCLPAFADAEMTLEELLAAHYEAIGGLEAWAKVDSIRLRGTMTMGQGIEAPTVMIKQRPDRMRLEFKVRGTTGIQAFDGETAWIVMPFVGIVDPEEVESDRAKSLMEQADFDGPLVDYENKGHRIDLAGLVEVEGASAHQLDVTLANGEVRQFFLDAESYVVIKTTGTTRVQGVAVEFETAISDYKPVGEPELMVPHSFASGPKGPAGAESQVIRITSVEVNPELADDLFTMPKKDG